MTDGAYGALHKNPSNPAKYGDVSPLRLVVYGPYRGVVHVYVKRCSCHYLGAGQDGFM
jgi:hypothetical protein